MNKKIITLLIIIFIAKDIYSQDPRGTDRSIKIEKKVENNKKGNLIDGFEFVKVEGGTFTMGCTSEQGIECDDDEKPPHSVSLSSFSIGKYEVTQAQWKSIMGNKPSFFIKCDDCPVEMVSWDDVQNFLQKLNSKTGKNYRLPTEAEWEFAARGGNKSKGYKYSGSNDINSVGWNGNIYIDILEIVGDVFGNTYRIGEKEPNELDIYDMTGNVWEWCSDWYGEYINTSQINPKGVSTGTKRVIRGGSWFDDALYSRVTSRYSKTSDTRYHIIGFRLVLP